VNALSAIFLQMGSVMPFQGKECALTYDIEKALISVQA